MVFIRSLLPLAALAATVLAAPAARRDLSVNSGGSSCEGSNCGSSDSSSSMDCGSGGCGSASSATGTDTDNTPNSMYSATGTDTDNTPNSMYSATGTDTDNTPNSMYSATGTDTDNTPNSMYSATGTDTDNTPNTMTYSASSSSATMMYGSGSSNWGMYESCVQQCVAEYGGSSGSSSYSGSSGSSESGSSGSSDSGSSDNSALASPTATLGSGGSGGATHTVIVAPTAGVLRFVPFAVEAAVGDTVEYIWGADLHTVTKGSALQLCNQSGDAATFNTGLQNHSFSYLQVVNDTKPTYFYCAHPGHCAKGMFGVINPLTSDDPALQAGSAQVMNSSMMGSASTMASMAYTQSAVANGTSPAANALAGKWGSSYSLVDIPDAMKGAFVENVLFTRSLIAMNPDLVSTDGSKLAVSTSGAPIMWPVDVAGAANLGASNNLAAAPAANAAAASTSATSAAPAASSPAGKKNGARGLAASGATVVLALAVSLLAL